MSGFPWPDLSPEDAYEMGVRHGESSAQVDVLVWLEDQPDPVSHEAVETRLASRPDGVVTLPLESARRLLGMVLAGEEVGLYGGCGPSGGSCPEYSVMQDLQGRILAVDQTLTPAGIPPRTVTPVAAADAVSVQFRDGAGRLRHTNCRSRSCRVPGCRESRVAGRREDGVVSLPDTFVVQIVGSETGAP